MRAADAVLESTTWAVFVGEPTGGKPNHTGDHSDNQLPYSGLHVSIASRLHQDAGPGDNRPALEPHIRVPVLAADYFGNRDPAFDAIVNEIRRR